MCRAPPIITGQKFYSVRDLSKKEKDQRWARWSFLYAQNKSNKPRKPHQHGL